MNLKFDYPEFIAPAFFDDDKFVNIVAGRRTGKTFNAAQWLPDELLDPKTEWDFNPMGLWVDTTQVNIDKYVDQYFKVILKDIWPYCHYRYDKKILKLPNGIPIIFASAERPDLLEGFAYQRAVLNESGIILKKASLWDNSLKPMFKGQNVKVRNIGTPKGKNKFHTLTAQYKTYHFSCYDSPFWNKAELDLIKTETPELVWKQEYLAEFIDGEGSVFRNILQCINDVQLQQAASGATYVMGVDLAKHQDFTVIMIADLNTKQVVYMDRFNQIDWSFQKQRILNAWNQFNRPKILLDATGVGNPIYDDLHNAGVNIEPFTFTPASKKELVWDLAVSLDNKSITFPNWEVLIKELEAFGYEMTRSGTISYNAPEGVHDDCVIALALVNKLLKSTIQVNLSFI